MSLPGDKPQILLITRNLPPLTGGMERLMQQTALGLSDYAELTIVGPSGCSAYCPANARIRETSPKLGPFLLLSIWHAANFCRSSQFTLIIGGSGLIAPALILLRMLFGGKSVVFLHGLDLVVGNFIYQRFFIPCIRATDHVVANSRNTLNIAVSKGVPAQRITIVNPGTQLPAPANIESRKDFFKRKRVPFKKVMLFVGRITRRKGLSSFIQNSLPLILEAEPEAGLIVVGENSDQSLTKFGEAREVMELVSRLNMGQRVMFLGQLSDTDLETCYAAADVHVFPLLDTPGDVEGFGMVAIEAAACGTPTVAFYAGGVADAISSENGILVETGRYDLFSKAVTRILREGRPCKEHCVEHAKKYGWDRYNKKIKSVISQLTQPG
jgi:phosphatidylinositol alpha-1,6-mannosyltransferase